MDLEVEMVHSRQKIGMQLKLTIWRALLHPVGLLKTRIKKSQILQKTLIAPTTISQNWQNQLRGFMWTYHILRIILTLNLNGWLIPLHLPSKGNAEALQEIFCNSKIRNRLTRLFMKLLLWIKLVCLKRQSMKWQRLK